MKKLFTSRSVFEVDTKFIAHDCGPEGPSKYETFKPGKITDLKAEIEASNTRSEVIARSEIKEKKGIKFHEVTSADTKGGLGTIFQALNGSLKWSRDGNRPVHFLVKDGPCHTIKLNESHLLLPGQFVWIDQSSGDVIVSPLSPGEINPSAALHESHNPAGASPTAEPTGSGSASTAKEDADDKREVSAELTIEKLSAMTPADFARITSHTLAKIPSEVLVKLPPRHFKALPSSVVTALPAPFFSSLTPAALKAIGLKLTGLPDATLHALEEDTFLAMLEAIPIPAERTKLNARRESTFSGTPEESSDALSLEKTSADLAKTLAAASPEAFKTISADRLSALMPPHFADLPDAHLTLLPAATLKALPDTHLASLRPITILALPTDTLKALPEDKLETLMDSLNSADKSLLEARINTDEADPAVSITPEKLSATLAEELKNGTPEVFAKTSVEVLKTLLPVDFSALPDTHLTLLPTATLKALPDTHLASLRPTTILALPTDTLKALPEGKLETLMGSLNSADKSLLEARINVDAATGAPLPRRRPLESSRPFAEFRKTPPAKLAKLSPSEFAALPVADLPAATLAALPPEHFSDLTPETVSAFSAEIFDALSPAVFNVLGAKLESITDKNLKEIDPDTFAAILDALPTPNQKSALNDRREALFTDPPALERPSGSDPRVDYHRAFRNIKYINQTGRLPELQKAFETSRFNPPSEIARMIALSALKESSYRWNPPSNTVKKKAMEGALAVMPTFNEDDPRVQGLSSDLKTKIKALEQEARTSDILKDDYELYKFNQKAAQLLRKILAEKPEYADLIDGEIANHPLLNIDEVQALISTFKIPVPKNHTELLHFFENMPRTFGPFQNNVYLLEARLAQYPWVQADYPQLFRGGKINRDAMVRSLLGVEGAPVSRLEMTKLLLDTYWRHRYDNHRQGKEAPLSKEAQGYMFVETLFGDMSTYRAAIQEALNDQIGSSLVIDGDLTNYQYLSPEIRWTPPSNTVQALDKFINEKAPNLKRQKNKHIATLVEADTWEKLQKSSLYQAIMGSNAGARSIPTAIVPATFRNKDILSVYYNMDQLATG